MGEQHAWFLVLGIARSLHAVQQLAELWSTEMLLDDWILQSQW